MQYQTFLTLLQELLSQRLHPLSKLSIQPILKNNGLHLDALCLTYPNDSVSPTIYANEYYDMFSSGKPLSEIVDEILHLFGEFQEISLPSLHSPFSFEQLRSHVAYRLVHTQMNTELLEKIPNVPFLDLSIVFYLYLNSPDHAPMSALIYTSHQETWGCTTQELLHLAMENTPRLLPPVLSTLESVLSRIIHTIPQAGSPFPDTMQLSSSSDHIPPSLYVLSNPLSYYGASCILYPNILKKFADTLQKDILLIPSSIHEFLLLPYETSFSYSSLHEMIVSVNQSSVSLEEQLSDHAYLYLRQEDQIILPPSDSIPN